MKYTLMDGLLGSCLDKNTWNDLRKLQRILQNG